MERFGRQLAASSDVARGPILTCLLVEGNKNTGYSHSFHGTVVVRHNGMMATLKGEHDDKHVSRPSDSGILYPIFGQTHTKTSRRVAQIVSQKVP